MLKIHPSTTSLFALLILTLSGAALKASEAPNFVFVLIDDQRHDTLGAAGHPVIQTPNVDRLAESGVRFENAFVNVSICMASRATILTGLTQRTHQYMPGNSRSKSILKSDVNNSFPAQLRANGYYTGFFGKDHVNFVGGNKYGYGTMFNQWENYHPNRYRRMPDGSMRLNDDLITESSLNFLKERPKDQPFFLYMSMNIAHADDKNHEPGIGHFPYPKSVEGMYADIEPARPVLDDPAIYEALPDFIKKSINRTRYFWRWDTPEKYRTNMRAYYRMITGVDGMLGEVLAELEAQGVRENTIVIYTSDNGFYMGERGLAGKWSHFDESMRVPMIIADPRVTEDKRGRVESSMALNLDLPVTILDLAGIEPPETYQGASLRPFVYGEQPTGWRTEVFGEHHQFARSIPAWSGLRSDRYVYARYDNIQPPYEFLHDLEADPQQLVNFSKDPAYADVLASFREKTDGYIERYTRGESTAKGSKSKQLQKAALTQKGGAVFKGQAFLKLQELPQLTLDSDVTWSMEVKIDPGCDEGAILMGNRKTAASDVFFKITPARGMQLYHEGRHQMNVPYQLPVGIWTQVRVEKRGSVYSYFVDDDQVGRGTISQPVPAMPCYLGGDPAAGENMIGAIRNVSVTIH